MNCFEALILFDPVTDFMIGMLLAVAFWFYKDWRLFV